MTVKDILIVYDMLGCIWLHHVHKAKSMLKTPCIHEIYHLIYINETRDCLTSWDSLFL